MRIPITINAPEDRRRRGTGYSLRDYPRASNDYGHRRDRTNLAIDYETEREDEVHSENIHNDWKDRYTGTTKPHEGNLGEVPPP